MDLKTFKTIKIMDYKYCKIYAANFENKESIIEKLSNMLSCKKVRNELIDNNFQIYVDNNEDFDSAKQSQFPDGFLYFAHCLDVDFESHIEKEYAISLTNRLLEWFWQNGHPAIAVCDYESELLNNGGCQSVPWVN